MSKDDPHQSQGDVNRCVAVGRLASLTGGSWHLGPNCTVQLEPHAGGWLLLRYAIDETEQPAKAHAAWLSDEQARQIARHILGGRP